MPQRQARSGSEKSIVERGRTICALGLLLAGALLLAAVEAGASSVHEDMLSADAESTYLPEEHPQARVEAETGKGLLLPLGPLFIQNNQHTLRLVLFPLFFHDVKKGSQGSRFTALFPFFTWNNWEGSRALVVFPVWWNFNLKKGSMYLVPPLYLEGKEGKLYRLFIAPLLFYQKGKKVSFQFVPPVFWRFKGEKTRFIYSLLFYRWVKGEDSATGILPLVYWGEKEGKGYGILFPLLWHFSDTALATSKTVFPPFYFFKELDDWKMGFIPILFANRIQNVTQATLLPLFHLRLGKEERSLLLVTPLGWYAKNEAKGAKGGGILLAHYYRSDEKRVLAIAPLFYHWSVPDLYEQSMLFFPLVYHSKSPVKRNVSVLGLVWDFHSYHEHRTFGVLPLFIHSKDLYRDNHLTWIFPTIQYQKNPEEKKLFIHPIFYLKHGGEKPYQVLFPIWWRFKQPQKLRQVAFPLFWDFQNKITGRRISIFFPLFVRFKKLEEVHTDMLLFYHWKGEKNGRKSWKFALLPLFGFGRTEPDDYYWKILFGLVGFEKEEDRKNLYLFWLPIKMKQ